MIDRDHDLSIVRQAKALGAARSSVYYAPRPVSTEDLKLMRRLDELHLDHPFAGARMLRNLLRREGVAVGRRHVATLMKRIGIEAIYRRPNTSKPAPGHKIYPYLLRGVTIERPNQVWATDISYIPMRRGFVYRQQRVFLSALRFLANDLRAALVCAGTDLARQALLTAAQLAERFEAFHLERWKNDGALAVSRSSPRGRRGRRAPLDDLGAARPVLALWIDDSGAETPSTSSAPRSARALADRIAHRDPHRGRRRFRSGPRACRLRFGPRRAPDPARRAVARFSVGRRSADIIPPARRPPTEYRRLALEILASPESTGAAAAPCSVAADRRRVRHSAGQSHGRSAGPLMNGEAGPPMKRGKSDAWIGFFKGGYP
jgi:hypothetical protein